MDSFKNDLKKELSKKQDQFKTREVKHLTSIVRSHPLLVKLNLNKIEDPILKRPKTKSKTIIVSQQESSDDDESCFDGSNVPTMNLFENNEDEVKEINKSNFLKRTGKNKNNNNSININLSDDEEDKKRNIHLMIGNRPNKSKNKVKVINHMNEDNEDYGDEIDRLDLRSAKIDNDDSLKRKFYRANRIFYNGYLSNPENYVNTFEFQAHAAELLNFLKSLWQSNSMVDLMITVGNKKYMAHKLALAMFSSKYKEEFQRNPNDNNREVNAASLYKITLSEDSTEFALESILKYIYTAEIDINPANAEEILATAKELCIDNLIYIANDYLKSLSFGDMLDFMSNMFDKDGAQLVFYELYVYMMNNLEKITRTPEYLRSTKSVVRALLSDSNLHVDDELEVFDAAIRWINYDRMSRIEYLNDIMQSIRFTLISPFDLATRIENQIGSLDNLDILKQIYNGYKYHSLRLSENNQVNYIHKEESRNHELKGASVTDEFIRAIKELAHIANTIKASKKLIRHQTINSKHFK